MRLKRNITPWLSTEDKGLFVLMLMRHFNYSIKDISSYDELTKEEKKFISRELFDKVTTNKD